MQLASGIDLVAIDTIAHLLNQHGDRFLRRVFTAAEIAYCTGKPYPLQHFAARFAAKEAAFKALGSGWGGGVGWRQIEVRSLGGQPELCLTGAALSRFRQGAHSGCSLALSHTTTHAIAMVTLY
jgi:holo-[acyl-carrier protein] synthase